MILTSDQAREMGRPGAEWSRNRRQARVEDYQFIGGDTMAAGQAAARIGVSKRTIHRYRAALRATECADA